MKDNNVLLLFVFHIYLNVSQYDNTAFLFTLFFVSNSDLFSTLYFSILILQRRSLTLSSSIPVVLYTITLKVLPLYTALQRVETKHFRGPRKYHNTPYLVVVRVYVDHKCEHGIRITCMRTIISITWTSAALKTVPTIYIIGGLS